MRNPRALKEVYSKVSVIVMPDGEQHVVTGRRQKPQNSRNGSLPEGDKKEPAGRKERFMKRNLGVLAIQRGFRQQYLSPPQKKREKRQVKGKKSFCRGFKKKLRPQGRGGGQGQGEFYAARER